MNILDYLDSKETGKSVEIHPFADKGDEFKYTYCFGIATLAFGYKRNLPDIGRCFSELLRKMKVNEGKEKQIISSIYTVFDFKITEVFERLQEKEEQYCFVADLYKIANGSLLSPTYCQDIISGYMRAFFFSKEEKDFFKNFMECAERMEKITEGESMVKSSQQEAVVKEAVEVYETFQNTGYEVSYELLQYMLPGFYRNKRIDDLMLSDGTHMRIDFPAEFFGRVEITKGSTLLIENTTLTFYGSIDIKGGKLLVKNSKIFVKECVEKNFIEIQETTLCTISGSEIDCGGKTAFLRQEGGNLYLSNSVIAHTGKNSAVTFSGRDIYIEGTRFIDCKNGAIWNDADGDMHLTGCGFSDCSREHGGAVYSQSIHNTYIKNCTFSHCVARYLGGAVYFLNRKYGQWVENCKVEQCAPEDSCIFNDDSYHLPQI